MARSTVIPVKDTVIPQQLGVGVSGGIELFTLGLKMVLEEAVRKDEDRVIVELDISNAHNDFPRDIALKKIIAAALVDPRLIPFAVAAFSTLMDNPIYLRSKGCRSGYDHLCDSRKGGGQGNALTGQIFVILVNDSLKEVESQHPGVTVKAIHDDTALVGLAADIFGVDGALGSLIDKLKQDCGLTINLTKCAVVGATPTACALKPDWLVEPDFFKNDEGAMVQVGARGIAICQSPIGEALFCQTFLDHKFNSICSVLKKSFSTLLPKDKHVAFQALRLSFQARFDYWLSTNLPSLTNPLARKVDILLKSMLEQICSTPLFSPAADGTPFPLLTAERAISRTKESGLGFRPIEERILLLNAVNLTLPQTLDRTNKNGVASCGLWDSLSSCLGPNSFDETNGNMRWGHWYNTDSAFAAELGAHRAS